jgi:hypothetical protein
MKTGETVDSESSEPDEELGTPSMKGDDDDDEVVAKRRQEEEEEEQKRRDELHKQRLLAGQKQREEEAAASGSFAKHQRVRYYHKTSDTWIEEAEVIGVHHDDGPEAYYTIQYFHPETSDKMEKQTTKDRLQPLEWNEEKMWVILSKKAGR